MKNKNGFTLIELMVVMTIIVVITAIGMVSYSAASLKSRDGRRMADLQKISLALEMYRQDNKVYPPAVGNKADIPATYLQAWPNGPKGVGDSYSYTLVSSYTYKIDTKVENAGSSNVAGGIYRVTNP